MKMILLGFADDKALTAPVVIAGPEVNHNEQASIFHQAKAAQKFPAGIRRLEFCALEIRDTAINVAPVIKSKK